MGNTPALARCAARFHCQVRGVEGCAAERLKSAPSAPSRERGTLRGAPCGVTFAPWHAGGDGCRVSRSGWHAGVSRGPGSGRGGHARGRGGHQRVAGGHGSGGRGHMSGGRSHSSVDGGHRRIFVVLRVGGSSRVAGRSMREGQGSCERHPPPDPLPEREGGKDALIPASRHQGDSSTRGRGGEPSPSQPLLHFPEPVVFGQRIRPELFQNAVILAVEEGAVRAEHARDG